MPILLLKVHILQTKFYDVIGNLLDEPICTKWQPSWNNFHISFLQRILYDTFILLNLQQK